MTIDTLTQKYKFGQDFVWQLVQFVRSIILLFIGIYLFTIFDFGGLVDNSSYFSIHGLGFLAGVILCGTQGYNMLEFGSKLMHDNQHIREVKLEQDLLHFPKSYKAEQLSKLSYQAITALEIHKIHNGFDYFFFTKSSKKLVIRTKREKFQILQKDLADGSDFMPLCEAIAKHSDVEIVEK